MTENLDETTNAIIGNTARTLKTRRIFRDWDREDLVAELTLHVLEQRPYHHPDKSSWHTFVRRVIACKACDMIRERAREHDFRRRTKMLSLDHPLGLDENGFPVTLPDVIPDTRPPFDEDIALAMDLGGEKDLLPADSKWIGEMLQDHTQTEVARRLHIPLHDFRKYRLAPLRRWLLKRRSGFRVPFE